MNNAIRNSLGALALAVLAGCAAQPADNSELMARVERAERAAAEAQQAAARAQARADEAMAQAQASAQKVDQKVDRAFRKSQQK